MKILLTTFDDFYAQIIKSKLNDVGIAAEVFDENSIFSMGTTIATGKGLRVVVPDEDYEQAKQIIADDIEIED